MNMELGNLSIAFDKIDPRHMALQVRVTCRVSGHTKVFDVGGVNPAEDAYALMCSVDGPADFAVRWFFEVDDDDAWQDCDSAVGWYDGLPPELPAALRLRWAVRMLTDAYRAAADVVQQREG